MTENDKLEFLEESIFDQRVVAISTEDRDLKLYPRKVTFFDGSLHLVGESLSEGCLMNIPLPSVLSLFEEEDEWSELYSLFEVNDFISSLRDVNENSVRLVLKIYSRENFELNLKSVYYEKPCMITNPKGDYIWAATLEASDEVYNWLISLGPSVEILDPLNFKKEFLIHCESRLKKLA